MLKNFCFCPGQFCSTSSTSSFNYNTLNNKPLATTQQKREEFKEEKITTIEEKIFKKPIARRLLAATNHQQPDYLSTYRSNSIDLADKSLSSSIVDDSGGSAGSAGSGLNGFSFLSSTTSSITNSIHFYHPKSIIQTPTATLKSNDLVSLSGDKSSHQLINTSVCTTHNNNRNLISNLTPLSETILRTPTPNVTQTKSTNKENLKFNRISGNNLNNSNNNNSSKNLVTSTTVINIKPSLPLSQPPSLDSRKVSSRLNLENRTNNIIDPLLLGSESKNAINSNVHIRKKHLIRRRNTCTESKLN